MSEVDMTAEVLRKVVGEACVAIFQDGELEAVFLRKEIGQTVGGFELSLVLSACGEDFHDTVFDSELKHITILQWRDRLISNLQDFVAESRFGWGQQR